MSEAYHELLKVTEKIIDWACFGCIAKEDPKTQDAKGVMKECPIVEHLIEYAQCHPDQC